MAAFNRKMRKLLRNPNRFFFDFFAKRVARHEIYGSNGWFGQVGELHDRYAEVKGYTYNPDIHPWVQVASRFGLRSGAATGYLDQSVLVASTDLFDVLSYTIWMAGCMNCGLRVYTMKGAVYIDIERARVFSAGTVEQIYTQINGKPDFVVEFLGEFKANFALHLYVYDRDADRSYVVRSDKAYLKKSVPKVFEEVYPKISSKSANWIFHTPESVDVVYTWVNKDDPVWQKLWSETFPEKSIDNDRYASKDELRYSIRAIAKYMPWIRNIYVVSNCSKPDWIAEGDRLKWVMHEEIFPNIGDLPTFNSHSIEACLHRISGISENFIYFNDDMFVNEPCSYNDFFDANGNSIAYFEPYGMVFDGNHFDGKKEYLNPAINCHRILADRFPFRKATCLHKHTPYALKKSVLDEIEGVIGKELTYTRSAKVRTDQDINLTSFFYHHYALSTHKAIEGDAPYIIVRPSNIARLTKAPGDTKRYKFLCFNDGDGSSDNEKFVQSYQRIMQGIFPYRGCFEL